MHAKNSVIIGEHSIYDSVNRSETLINTAKLVLKIN
jgi:hypothetical protein